MTSCKSGFKIEKMLQQTLIQENLMSKPTTVSPSISAGFHALSEPLRLQVLELLRNKELCVCDLSEALGIPQSKLSFHLKVLKEAQLLRSRQEGRWMYYSIDLPQFVVLEQYLAEFRRFSPILAARSCEK
jgi:ArsR family transcriptional regulator, arsenate/arsenite/antimonite-responsive transcriptional repressor